MEVGTQVQSSRGTTTNQHSSSTKVIAEAWSFKGVIVRTQVQSLRRIVVD